MVQAWLGPLATPDQGWPENAGISMISTAKSESAHQTTHFELIESIFHKIEKCQHLENIETSNVPNIARRWRSLHENIGNIGKSFENHIQIDFLQNPKPS